jgi:hypothetical protein
VAVKLYLVGLQGVEVSYPKNGAWDNGRNVLLNITGNCSP